MGYVKTYHSCTLIIFAICWDCSYTLPYVGVIYKGGKLVYVLYHRDLHYGVVLGAGLGDFKKCIKKKKWYKK